MRLKFNATALSVGAASRSLPMFLAATIVLQLLVAGVGAFLLFSLPSHRVEIASTADIQQFETLAPEAAILEPELETPIESEPEVVPQARVESYTVAQGDTLSSIWSRFGAPLEGAYKAAEAFKKAGVSLATLKVGEDLELQIDAANEITALRKQLPEGRVLILDGCSSSGYKHKFIEPKVVEERREVSGRIDSSFSEAARQRDIPYEAIDTFVDLFSGQVEFQRDVQPGDVFSVIYTLRSTEQGAELCPGPVEAASFTNKGKRFVALRYGGDDNHPRYYDAKGELLGNFFLRYPLNFSRISSAFSGSRFHPVLKTRRPHNGVDFAAPIGTPVRSVADGVVVLAGYNGGAGKMIKIQHSSRYATAYLHLSRIGAGIRKGMRVSRGQVIGAVGMTGWATGPHLHFSFYDNGRYVDPLRMKLPTMPSEHAKIPPTLVDQMLERLAGLENSAGLKFAVDLRDLSRHG